MTNIINQQAMQGFPFLNSIPGPLYAREENMYRNGGLKCFCIVPGAIHPPLNSM